MTLTLTWQSIITAGAVLGALGVVIGAFVKVIRWMDHQKEQDDAQAKLKAELDKDMKNLREEQAAQTRAVQKEQTMICYGVKACLQGLIEKGCDGPCKDALNKLDKHLNQAAHEGEE